MPLFNPSVFPSRQILTTSPLTGGGDLTVDRTISFSNQAANLILAGPSAGIPAAPSFRALVSNDLPVAVVLNTRNILSTAPLQGGGDLSADRTVSINNLTTVGTANQIPGTNAGATAWEYKTFSGTANQITIADAANAKTWSLPDPLTIPGVCTVVGIFSSGGYTRVTTQFDKANDTTLADIPGLAVTLAAGATYRFRAVLHVTSDSTGGHKYAIAGTATATAVIFQISSLSNTTGLFVVSSRQTVMGGSAGQSGTTPTTQPYTEINGLITVNAGGTIVPQFAQNTLAIGTSSVLIGSTLEVERVS